MHINIRSFNKNGGESLLLLQELVIQFSAVIISETWFNVKHIWLDIPGYAAYHLRRPEEDRGEVLQS